VDRWAIHPLDRAIARPDDFIGCETILKFAKITANAVAAAVITFFRESLAKKIFIDLGAYDSQEPFCQISVKLSLTRGSFRPWRSVNSFFIVHPLEQHFRPYILATRTTRQR
jgi:hypothetical protein